MSDVEHLTDDRAAPRGGGEPFSAIDALLVAAALRRDGRPAEALALVWWARTVLAAYLPADDRTLTTMDETIADLRGETATVA